MEVTDFHLLSHLSPLLILKHNTYTCRYMHTYTDTHILDEWRQFREYIRYFVQ